MGLYIGTNSLAVIAVLLCISAFASSSETAFFSLNRFQLRRIRERFRPSYDRIRTLLRYPSRLLIMILLMNEVVNISISTLTTEFLQKNLATIFDNPFLKRFESSENFQWLFTSLVSLFLTLPLLLLFGEITPKYIAAKMNRLVAMLNCRPLIVLYKIIYPVLWVFDFLISTTLQRFKAEGRDHLSKAMSVLSEEDFMVLMEQGHREGTVHHAEKRLIKNVFEFDDSTVADVMTPIHQAFSVSASAKLFDILPEIQSQKYSRVPVHHKTRRKIAGILYIKDLLTLRNHPKLAELDVKSLMTRPMYVGPNVRLSVLFRRFKETKTHMAVVINRSIEPDADDEESDHDAIGVVTMEDVLESIFGEISDERDIQS
ncbi:MAG: hemolysin family protein [Bdellovibrionota bacterium]